jgi:hypothetical protein
MVRPASTAVRNDTGRADIIRNAKRSPPGQRPPLAHYSNIYLDHSLVTVSLGLAIHYG